jgi:hypothetical protein
MRTGPFSKYENRSGSQIWCPVRTWAVLIRRFSWQLSPPVLTAGGFQLASENRPTLLETSFYWGTLASCPHITHPERAALPLEMDYLDAFDFVLCSVNQLWLLFSTTLRIKHLTTTSGLLHGLLQLFLMSYRPHKWHFLLGIVIGWQMSQNIAMELRPEDIDFCGQVESTLILGNMVCVGLSTPLYISPKPPENLTCLIYFIWGSQNPQSHRVVE